jgi:D-alanyl-lipoteichoic acid acyltransferase DltB (MBOAT superfamily)
VLFNSYEFIFVFLPLALAGFYLFGRASWPLALGWLILVSLGFYAWWRPVNVLIIAPSIAVNYLLARALLRMQGRSASAAAARAVLVAGIVFNICFLGYFKYVNFLATAANDLAGTQFVLHEVILPLGISFITFQKVAFLIDVHGRRVQSFTLREYALFVLFFPQLISGPIVHYREMMPQFQQASGRFNAEDAAVGITLFVIGLFKKVVLADGVAVHVTPLYELAAAGGQPSLLAAWIAALGFTLQIYFDFSGYSDMALGLARFFGVRLPANFDSPLKATSIIDFWLRWHMTLTRFLTAYLYNPLVLWLTRRRLAQGRPGLTARAPVIGAFATLLAAPTLLTMLVSGLWHGAGYLFILWGGLHGVYLCVAHAWRLYGARLWRDRGRYERLMRPVGFVLTFASVVVGMVVFRATSPAAAGELLQGMVGANGITLPASLAGPLRSVMPPMAEMSGQDLIAAVGWIAALLAIALLLPNSLQLLARFGPALALTRPIDAGAGALRLGWTASLPWAAAVSALAAVAVVRLGGKSEFLYWQF